MPSLSKKHIALSKKAKQAVKVSVLFVEWKDYHGSMGRLRKTTLKNYTHYLRRFVEAYPDLTLGGLTASLVRRYVAEETARSKHVGYAVRAALCSLCQYAFNEGLIIVKPTDYLEAIKADSPESVPATNSEIKALFAACDRLTGSEARKTEARALLALLTYGGVRIGEALSVRLGDINFTTCELLVREGKGGKEREVFFSEDALPYLLLHVEGKKKEDRVIGYSPSGGQYLFHRLRTIAHCPHVTPHKLRHAIACRMLDNGVDLATIQKFLGHENIATTSIYLHSNKEKLKQAARSGSLDPKPKEPPTMREKRVQDTRRRLRIDLRRITE